MFPAKRHPTGPLFTRARRASLWASAIAAGVALAALVLPLLGGSTYFGLDLDRCDRGLLCQLQDLLGRGDPLWIAPYLGNGSPLLARPEAQLFYPVRWLALALPLDLAVNLSPVLHLAIGAASAAWLARTFRVRPVAAACAGLAWALSGTTLNLTLHANYVVAAAWLPLVWAGGRRAAHHRTRRLGLWAAGGSLGLLLLGGELQAYAMGCALLVVEAVRAARTPRGRRRLLPSLLATLPLSVAMGAVAWIPLVVEGQLTARATLQSLADASRWSFVPELFPFVLWSPPVEASFPYVNLWSMAVAGVPGDISAWNPTPYLGPLLLASAVCGAFLLRQWVLAGVGLASVLLSLQPVFGAVAGLLEPMLWFRYPQKYLLVASLVAVVLGVGFLDRLGRRPTLLRPFVLASCLLLGFTAAVYTWLGAQQASVDALFAPPIFIDTSHVLESMARALRACLLQSAAPLAIALASALLRPPLRRWLVLLIVADLLAAAPAAVHVGASFEGVQSPLRELREADLDPAQGPAVLCTHNQLERSLLAIPGAPPAWGRAAVDRLLLSTELQACEAIIAAIPYSPIQTTMNERLADAFNQYRLAPARALGCTHILSAWPMRDQPAVPLPTRFWPMGEAAGSPSQLQLSLIPDPVPPAFVARHPRLAASEVEVLQRVLPTTASQQVIAIVDDPLHRLPADQLPTGEGAGDARVQRENPSRLVLDVAGRGSAVVGLRTAFAVGWRAQQSQREVPVVRASGQHLAAVVEDVAAGSILFEYRSPYFRLSLVLTALGWVGLLALSWRPGSRSPGRSRAR